MAKKPVNKTPRQQIREREQRETLEASRKKALGKFHPKKAERLSYVFIDGQGNRLKSTSRRVGYLVYVGRTGKKQTVKDPRTKSTQLKASRISSITIDSRKRKTAAKKFFSELTPTKTTMERIIPTRGETLKRQGVDFGRVASNIGEDLRRTSARQRTGKQFVVNINFTVREKGSKKLRNYETKTSFKQQDLQKISKAGFKRYVFTVVYGFLAESLKRDGFVPAGSARFIRKLKGNAGKSRQMLKTKDGDEWSKSELQDVEIMRVEWTIDKVTIRS